MHMSDALLSPAVAGAMAAAGVGAVAYALYKIRRDGDTGSIPLMGVSGAFVFAAQMINIAIPGTGASGHLTGGVLLAALLGPYRALITLSAVLLVQCLFFADGGLLAYGCNVFNLGVCAGWLAYTLVYAPIVRRGFSKKRLVCASLAASVLGLQAGAFAVVLETVASGIAGIPLGLFAALMQPIHLAIGLLEGVVTAGVLLFMREARPALLAGYHTDTTRTTRTTGDTLMIILVLALLIGGGLSLFASQQPDGLEWSLERAAGETTHLSDAETTVEATDALYETADRIVQTTAIMPDYTPPDGFAPSLAGIVGCLLLVVPAGVAGYLLRRFSRRNRKSAIHAEKG